MSISRQCGKITPGLLGNDHDLNQTLVTAGYRINDFTRLFFTQRLASSPIVPIGDLSHTGFASLMSKTETRIGIETRLKRTISSTTRYQLENGMNGTDSFAVLGFVDQLSISKKLSADWAWKWD